MQVYVLTEKIKHSRKGHETNSVCGFQKMLVYEITYFQLIGNAVGLVPVAQRSSALESMAPGMGRAVRSPQEAETGGNPPRLSFFQSSRNKLPIGESGERWGEGLFPKHQVPSQGDVEFGPRAQGKRLIIIIIIIRYHL